MEATIHPPAILLAKNTFFLLGFFFGLIFILFFFCLSALPIEWFPVQKRSTYFSIALISKADPRFVVGALWPGDQTSGTRILESRRRGGA